jgi:hypothetical protein
MRVGISHFVSLALPLFSYWARGLNKTRANDRLTPSLHVRMCMS